MAKTRSTASGRRAYVWIALPVAACLALFYGLFALALEIGRTEGDVPASSSLQLPVGTVVVSDDVTCASGGCWRWMVLEPADDDTPAQLAQALGATPDGEVGGWLFNPRTTFVHAVENGDLLGVSLSYWSDSGHALPRGWS